MNLTARRKEFLKKIREIYDRTQGPIHYNQLADEIGVSKWTAYDMVRELIKDGFLTSEYTVKGKGEGERTAGRSQLVFSPTKKADDVFADQKASHNSQTWQVTKHYLQHRISAVSSENQGTTARELAQEALELDTPLLVCAYMVSILVISLKTSSILDVKLINKHLDSNQIPLIALAFVAGIASGIDIAKETQVSAADVNTYLKSAVERFLDSLAKTEIEERQRLLKFVKEQLANLR